MKLFDSPKFEMLERICWYLMLCLSIAPLGFAVSTAWNFSTIQIIEFGLIFAISLVVNRYHYTIPGTQTDISAKELVIFWGVMWLGVAGGILLAFSITLAKLGQISNFRKQKWFFDFFTNAVSTFISGSVFYLALKFFSGITENSVGQSPVNPGWVIISAVVMAFTHFCLTSVIATTYLKAGKRFEFVELWKRNFLPTAATYASSTVAVLVVYSIFLQAGFSHLLIGLPAVVAGHIIYRIFVRKLAQKTREITEASRIHLATVEALATAIDARDQIGIGHVRRTQIYSVGIGELMGLTSDEIQALNAGALLHGIGKLAIPDNILNKPGRLTKAEKEKTKIHSVVGASIIENIQFPYPVATTVRHYNELWSGNGYPDRLTGDEIPVTARILAVADAYDTLRGERPYRKPVTREQARRILQNGSGTKYDPKIVDIFLRNLNQLEAIIEEKGLSYLNSENSIGIAPHSGLEDAEDKDFVNRIKSANREVFTMYELARVFSSSLNLEETLAVFAAKIKEQVPFDTCVVYLMQESDSNAKAVYTQGKYSSAFENKCIEAGEGITGKVLQNLVPVCEIDPAEDLSPELRDFAGTYSAMASLPLLVEDKLLGAVSIYSCEIESYGDEHLRLIEMVSQIASDAIYMARQHAESETRALTDPMTGLPNARSLQIQFEKEVARANRNGSNFQLLMLDLDGFKAVNDTYGHNAGDLMLKGLADVMKQQLRDYDFLSRYAGDEFVIIVPETNRSGIEELCERLEKAVAEFTLPIDDGRFASVGVSLGASCYPTDGETIDQIIISADKKMYGIKAERKLKKTLPDMKVEPEPKSAKNRKETAEDVFVVELDESHIVSTALN